MKLLTQAQIDEAYEINPEVSDESRGVADILFWEFIQFKRKESGLPKLRDFDEAIYETWCKRIHAKKGRVLLAEYHSLLARNYVLCLSAVGVNKITNLWKNLGLDGEELTEKSPES
jgi:hypothetical protein